MKWEKWFAWYPVKLENNDYATLEGKPRRVWLKYVYRASTYYHTGDPMNPLIGFTWYRNYP